LNWRLTARAEGTSERKAHVSSRARSGDIVLLRDGAGLRQDVARMIRTLQRRSV
jgi:hypothetical protein